MNGTEVPPDDDSSDSADRRADFLARHGGPSSAPTRQESRNAGISGWWEIYAADGYTLRCDWSRFGSREDMRFSELPPRDTKRSP
jgi:hypothetical protein